MKVAALQTALTDDVTANVARVTELVREAHGKGAQVILPSELFEGHYFCRSQREEHFARAHAAEDHPTLRHFSKLTPTGPLIRSTASFSAGIRKRPNSP